MERILKIEPLEDLTLEFDVMERGRVVHDVLAAFHKKVNARLGRPGSPLELDEAEFKTLLDAAIQESLPPEPRQFGPSGAPRGRSPAGGRMAVALSRASREVRCPVERF